MLDKINPKWALIWVLIGAAGFNSLMAVGNTLTWFNVTWFLSRAVYVSLSARSLPYAKVPTNKRTGMLLSQSVMCVAVKFRSATVMHANMQFPGERHVQQHLLEVL